MKIGMTEIIVVLIIALIVVGPDKLPEYMKALGKGLSGLKKATAEMNEELQKDVIEPLNEAQKPLKEALQPVQDTADEIRKTVEDTGKMMNQPLQTTLEKNSQEWTCPKCGKRSTSKFCPDCGTAKVEKKEEGEGNV